MNAKKMTFQTRPLAHVAMLLLVCPVVTAAEPVAARVIKVDVEPAELTLSHPRFGHRLLVTGTDQDGHAVDLTSDAVWSSRNSFVAEVRAGRIWPRGNGQTVVAAEVAGRQLEVPVRVQGFHADPPIQMRTELEPVLTKTGCNAGACHGSQYGKGGFKLSLFGGEPATDHAAITRDQFGRRANTVDPSESLLLLKPTNQVSHEGGRRLSSGDRAYETLRHWLADGCPIEKDEESARVVGLELLPRERVFTHRDCKQTMLAIASLSDGSKRDVTSDCRFDSNTPNIVSVDPDGQVTTLDQGEGVVMVRYLNQVEVSRYLVVHDDPGFTWSDPPTYNFIDDLVDAKLQKMHYLPSPVCSDEEFLRRACLDTIGTLPRIEELDGFLADPAPSREKRARYIDDLLTRPEFAIFWTLQWDDWLHNFGRYGTIKPMFALRNWVHASLRDNRPLDQFATELITSRGNTYRVGPANFYRLHQKPEDLTEAVATIFLGVRLECAKCHQHPFEKWTQDDYYGLAAYFARVSNKDGNEYGPVRGIYGGDMEVLVAPTGDMRNPRNGKIMAPTPLGSHQPVDDPADRRKALARWLTAPSNPQFAKNMANRHWAHFLGRGLVEPVDDLRDSNPPTNPELLDALAQDLISHGYDLRHLLRTILNSRTYQLSSRAVAGNAADTVYYSHYYPKRLRAEPLLDAVCFATGAPEKFPAMPVGTRAISLPAVMSSEVRSYFLDVFGRPQRTFDKCECVRVGHPNLAQVLHLMNGEWLHDKVTNANGRLPTLVKSGKTDQQIIVELYRVAFLRLPTDDECQTATELLTRAPTRQEGLEDLLWTLCNCKEFLFNH